MFCCRYLGYLFSPIRPFSFTAKSVLSISHHLALEADQIFEGAIKLDKSCFDSKRKGKRSRGVAEKVVVFGILKCGGKVYTVVVESAKRESLLPVITKKIMPDSMVCTD